MINIINFTLAIKVFKKAVLVKMMIMITQFVYNVVNEKSALQLQNK